MSRTSSYANTDISFGDIFELVSFLKRPKRIVEFGILDGYSLSRLVSANPDATIEAYDIFDNFVGNHANRNEIEERFAKFPNVSVKYGDFLDDRLLHSFEDESVDLLHIDIANNGDVYERAIRSFLPKVSRSGVMMLEGGSEARDHVEWMEKYDKRPIREVLQANTDLSCFTIEAFPSMTLITR